MNYTQKDPDNPTLAASQAYIEAGLSVVPLKVDGTKSPVLAWQPYQHRQASEHELHQWYDNGDPCGIGVVAGKISGNLHVLDFDIDAEKHFGLWWDDVCKQLPEIHEKIVVVATPRPGRQVWFRQSTPPPGNQVLALTEPKPQFNDDGSPELDADGQQVSKPECLIETRGEGGYVVAVGSPPEVHKSGKPYQLIYGSFDNLPELSDDEVETLLSVCRGLSQYVSAQTEQQQSEPYNGEPRPGDVFNQKTDIRELLQKHKWQLHHEDHHGIEYWTRPGKNVSDGYSATLGYLHDKAGRSALYVFSSAAAPFEAQKSYDAFAVFAYLEHGEDFSAAAVAAREMFPDELATQQREYHAKPLPDSFLEFEAFPIDALLEPVHSYVIIKAHSIGVQPAMVAVPILAMLASLVGRSRTIRLRDSWYQPAIIWTALICGIGESKTPTMQAAMLPARKVEDQLKRNNLLKKVELEKQMAAWERDKKKGPKPARPFESQLLISNATIEALSRRLAANKNGLMYAKNELAGWTKSFNQYRSKGEDGEIWLGLWDGRFESIDRVTDNFHLAGSECTISVTGTIQPEVARKVLLAEETTENGLAARLLVCHPDNPFVPDDGSSRESNTSSVESDICEIGRRLYALMGLENQLGESEPIALQLSDGARDVFFPFKNWAKRETRSLPEGPLAGACSKLDNQCAAISLVLSVTRQVAEDSKSDAKGAVTAVDMKAAVTITKWFWREARRFYAQLEEDASRRYQRSVCEWMRRSGKYEVSARDVVRGNWQIKTTEEAEAVLRTLVADEFGEMVDVQSEGRPSRKFRLFR